MRETLPQQTEGTFDPKAKAGSPWPPKDSQEGLGPRPTPGWEEGNEGPVLCILQRESPSPPAPPPQQRRMICLPEVERHPRRTKSQGSLWTGPLTSALRRRCSLRAIMPRA